MIARKGAGRERAIRRRTCCATPTSGAPQEWIGYRKDGTKFAMELDLSDVQLGSRISDIALPARHLRARALHETLQHQALHDPLTGLPNRVLFGDRVNNAIRASVRTHEPLALLVIDLDGFKHVNDTLGHHHGDDLLKLVADRLVRLPARRRHGRAPRRRRVRHPPARRRQPPRRRVGRLEDPGRRSSRRSRSRATRSRCAPASASRRCPSTATTSTTCCAAPTSRCTTRSGSARGYALFAAEQEDAPARRLALLGDLRHCIERDELVLHYQPKIDLVTRADARRRGADPLEPPLRQAC